MNLGRAWRGFKLKRLKNSSKRRGLLYGIRSAPKWVAHNRRLARRRLCATHFGAHNRRLARQMKSTGFWEQQKSHDARADRIEADAAQTRQELKNRRKQI